MSSRSTAALVLTLAALAAIVAPPSAAERTAPASRRRLLRHYMQAWGRDRVALVGYSRGADLLRFVAGRLPADLRGRLSLVAMLGLVKTASFEFHWSDFLRDSARPTDLAVAPELERLRGTRTLCAYGSGERDSLCRAAYPERVTRVERRGAHHFDNDVRTLGVIVADALDLALAGAR